MSEKYEYVYPVEELDKIIEEMMNGIQPMLDDQMELEVKLRWKERQKEEFGIEDEDEVDAALLRQHHEAIKKSIENDKRKASRRDVIELKISDEQKAKIREEMSCSIVRPDPNDPYNLPDSQVNENKEAQLIRERLKGLRNCYYNQTDYVNAIKIITDAIELSLGKYGSGDYPWLTYEEAVREFNAGNIKFKYCEIPKLYINHSQIITDPEILKGVISGDIVLKNRHEEKTEQKRKNGDSRPVHVKYTVTGDDEYAAMVAAHRQGYDTPLSAIIRYKSTVYSPKMSPFLKNDPLNNLDSNGEPILFDWMREGAGAEYYDLVKCRKPSTTDLIRSVDSDNGGMFDSSVYGNAGEFLNSMKTEALQTGGYDYTLPNYLQPPVDSFNYNEDAAKIERELYDTIRMNNPMK